MSIESMLRTALLNMDAVTALTGTGDAARIRPDKLDDCDDKELQHIVIEVDRATPQNSLDGLGGLTFAEVNISCRGASRAKANALAEAVKRNGTTPGTGLAGYGGSGTSFDSYLEDEVSGMTNRDDNSQRAWYTVEQTYIVSFTENV